MTLLGSSFSGVRMVADDAVTYSTFVATPRRNVFIEKPSRMPLVLAAISVGGLHRLDEFIFKR